MSRAYAIHLEQASSAFTLTDVAARADFIKALRRHADVVTFTEVAERHAQLEQACRLTGYQLALPSKGDTAIAVRTIHTILEFGTITSIPGHKGKASDGGHGPRPIQWVRWRPLGTSEVVLHATAHWVTRKADTGGQQVQMTEQMASLVRNAAGGHRLGFWSGDTNNPDTPRDRTPTDKALARGDLTSCWDELGTYPETVNGATIDVVGSYDPDVRVACARVRRWPQANGDHRAVSAWYTLANPRH